MLRNTHLFPTFSRDVFHCRRISWIPSQTISLLLTSVSKSFQNIIFSSKMLRNTLLFPTFISSLCTWSTFEGCLPLSEDIVNFFSNHLSSLDFLPFLLQREDLENCRGVSSVSDYLLFVDEGCFSLANIMNFISTHSSPYLAFCFKLSSFPQPNDVPPFSRLLSPLCGQSWGMTSIVGRYREFHINNLSSLAFSDLCIDFGKTPENSLLF